MHWFLLVAIAYFFLIVLFLSFGMGKIFFLMAGADAWTYLKDVLEVVTWGATVGGIYLAVKTYISSEYDKKLIIAKDSLGHLINQLDNLDRFYSAKWEIINGFSDFENRLDGLKNKERRELVDRLSALSKTLLKRLRPHHIFPMSLKDYPRKGANIFEISVNGEVSPFEGEDSFVNTVKALARVLWVNDKVMELKAGFFVKDAESSYDVLMKVIQYAQPYAYDYFANKQKIGETPDLRYLAKSIEDIPTAFVLLKKSPARNEFFIEAKEIG